MRRLSNQNLVYLYTEHVDTEATRQLSFFAYVVLVSVVIAVSCGATVYAVLTVLYYNMVLYLYGVLPLEVEIAGVVNPVRQMCALFASSAVFVVMFIGQNEKWTRLVSVVEERQYQQPEDTSRLNYAESLVRSTVTTRRSGTSKTTRYGKYNFSNEEWKRLAIYLEGNNWQLGSRDNLATVRNDKRGVLFSNITKEWRGIQRELRKCGLIDEDNNVTDDGREWFEKFLPYPGND